MVVVRRYTEELDSLELGRGFFEGWPNPPNDEVQRLILKQSHRALVAIDTEKKQIVGFITAISDGVLSAYIPLLEVLPAYRKQGTGMLLVNALLEELKDLYMVDLCCDQELQPFYEKCGMIKSHGMIQRNYQAQSGRHP